MRKVDTKRARNRQRKRVQKAIGPRAEAHEYKQRLNHVRRILAPVMHFKNAFWDTPERRRYEYALRDATRAADEAELTASERRMLGIPEHKRPTRTRHEPEKVGLASALIFGESANHLVRYRY
ncbi:MAG: hypothetical protein ABA06_04520 [Parcubacteria bacterium C7867-001]|nr:MAG: hypothetical protein ABA06_04520 [Parcubacteria bacterium C7867-001]